MLNPQKYNVNRLTFGNMKQVVMPGYQLIDWTFNKTGSKNAIGFITHRSKLHKTML